MEFVLPLCIMAFINLFLTYRLLFLAFKFIKNKDIKLSQFQLYDGDFPDKLYSARYQFQNMFEVPILFYLLCLLHINLNMFTIVDVYLAWGFVLFRVVHFLFRLQNQRDLNIRPRTLTFVLSLVCLSIGWIKFFINFILI
ncbi:MAG: hypothetical protein CBE33_02790 [Candidatus Pelagibacter sp. TMED273]|nr:MAG: hypothetical protein CBE33_02790 [Candidatus Pelagibacter sp. TMED273]|tara:strand:- start:9574 stop:9993 length:420 start_codon:yes stop_codon:yes gene_type:complete